MSCCDKNACSSSNWCSKTCSIVTGVLRIALGIARIYFGVSKFGTDVATMETLGGAAVGLFPFLDFLPNTTWFWIATIWEILVGLFLLSGCKKLARCAAVISLIILVFISDFAWWRELKTFVLAAVWTMIVYNGVGAFVICPMPCCKGGKCGWWSCDRDENVIEVE